MKLYDELYRLEDFEPWSGAVETYNKIIIAGYGEEFIQQLDGIYPDGITQTQLNDLLWFEEEWCYEIVGLNKWGVEPVSASDIIDNSDEISDTINDKIDDYLKEHDECSDEDFKDLDAYYFEQEIDDWLEDNQGDETDFDTLAVKWLSDVGWNNIRDAVSTWIQ